MDNKPIEQLTQEEIETIKENFTKWKTYKELIGKVIEENLTEE